MRLLLTGLLLLGMAAPALRADDKVSKAGEEFRALKKDYDAAQKKFAEQQKELRKQYRDAREAKDDEEMKKVEKKFNELMADRPGLKFAPRFLQVAEKDPSDPTTLDALRMTLRTVDGPGDKGGVWDKALAILQKDFVKVPEVKRVLRVLASSGDESAEQFVRDVLEKNPNRVTQARAAQALLDVAEDRADQAKRIKEDKELRAKLELNRGKEFVDKLLAKGEKAHAEQRELDRLIKKKYADIVPDLSVGQKAPDVVGHDLDGKPVKLSDYKGKVVVLDVWATWCGPCKAMIPGERELVGKLKGKPFALISVSVDEEKQTLKEFLAETKMPWTHWWNGEEGGIVEEWNVRFYPSVYVIDAKGVIRLDPKGFLDGEEDREEKLADLVNELVKETERKGTN